MNFELSQDDLAFRARLRAWLADSLDPDWLRKCATRDDWASYQRYWDRALFRGGWAGLWWPPEHGGMGATASQKAIFELERARAGEGPSLLLVNTYRYHGHHVGDVSREYYRSKQEELQWKTDRDPIRIMGDWLTSEGLADRAALDQIHDEVKAEIDSAVKFALAAPYPSPDKVDQDVYA